MQGSIGQDSTVHFLYGNGLHALWTDRSYGDLSDQRELEKICPTRRLSWLKQIHSGKVLVVEPGQVVEGAEADALVTADPWSCLAIRTADCAPIALFSPEGIVAAVHAGWRGTLAGVIPNTVEVMRSKGSTEIVAAIGPCIHLECYSFSTGDLDPLIAKFGNAIKGSDKGGQPALNLPELVAQALQKSDVQVGMVSSRCTGCDSSYFSYRVRRDSARQALLVWRDQGTVDDQARSANSRL